MRRDSLDFLRHRELYLLAELIRRVTNTSITEFCRTCNISTKTYYAMSSRRVNSSCYFRLLHGFARLLAPEDIHRYAGKLFLRIIPE